MSYYFPGVDKAESKVKAMKTEGELLAVLDDLYGRDNLPDEYTFDMLKDEAIAQVRREWTDTSSNEYLMAQAIIFMHKETKQIS